MGFLGSIGSAWFGFRRPVGPRVVVVGTSTRGLLAPLAAPLATGGRRSPAQTPAPPSPGGGGGGSQGGGPSPTGGDPRAMGWGGAIWARCTRPSPRGGRGTSPPRR